MKKQLIILTGAGMSAESGLATFRDADGLWANYRVEDVATPEGWLRNPELVLDFYNQRRKELLEVLPNKGHQGIADLEKEFEVTVITQNVDNLHERAGSSRVIHLHGELTKVCSENDLSLVSELSAENQEIHWGDRAADGSQLRPFIVWFGEAVPEIERAIRVTRQADIFVVIGTSLQVYPAAGLLHDVRPGIPIFLIDPKPVRVSADHPVTQIMKGASEGVTELIARLQPFR